MKKSRHFIFLIIFFILSSPGSVFSQDFDWREWGAREAKYAPAGQLQKAQYLAARLGQELKRQGIDPNYSYVGRVWSKLKHGNQALGTCQDLTEVVKDAFGGAGFAQDQICSVMASKQGIARLNKLWLFDPNLDHVAPVLVIDGMPYVFDLWLFGGERGHFAGFNGSVWNGIPLKSWGETLQGYSYSIFYINYGLKNSQFGPARLPIIIEEVLRRASPGPAIGKSQGQTSGATEAEIVSAYKGIYPVYLNTFHRGNRIDILASADKKGNGYFSAHKVYCIVKDGPRKNEEYCCASFEREYTLSQLQAATREMQRFLEGKK
jgi:hypothetical protein